MYNASFRSAKGSVLVLAILISSILLVIAVYLSKVSVSQFRSATATDNSVAAFESAESGIELALEAVNKNAITEVKEWNPGFTSSCTDGVVTFSRGNRTYNVIFFRRNDTDPDAEDRFGCNDDMTSGGTATNRQTVGKIRCQGIYLNTVRAVDAQVLDEA